MVGDHIRIPSAEDLLFPFSSFSFNFFPLFSFFFLSNSQTNIILNKILHLFQSEFKEKTCYFFHKNNLISFETRGKFTTSSNRNTLYFSKGACHNLFPMGERRRCPCPAISNGRKLFPFQLKFYLILTVFWLFFFFGGCFSFTFIFHWYS
jgi:hypothetical protein